MNKGLYFLKTCRNVSCCMISAPRLLLKDERVQNTAGTAVPLYMVFYYRPVIWLLELSPIVHIYMNVFAGENCRPYMKTIGNNSHQYLFFYFTLYLTLESEENDAVFLVSTSTKKFANVGPSSCT